MQNKDFINEILNKIKCKDAHNDISNELNSHIADLKEKYIEEGNTPELAEKKSIEQMGDSTIIADGFNKIYKYNFDWVLLTIVSLLFLCGIIVGNMLISNNFTININIISICLSTIIGVALILCNYKKLQNYSKILFFITFVITILAKFVPIISNFYLIILALYLISFSGNIVNTKLNLKTTAMIILSLLVTAFSLGKINFFLLAISFIILYISQNKLIINKYTISIFCIICAISLMLIIHNYDNSNYISAFLHPTSYQNNEGYIYLQKSKLLNNLNLWGNINNHQDLSISDLSDYNLFTFILTKVGIIGTSLLLLLYVLFIIRLLKNIHKVSDSYGKSILIGLISLFSIQIVLNILNGINIIPYTRICLPFLTMDSFNIISNIFLISIFISIYRRKNLV